MNINTQSNHIGKKEKKAVEMAKLITVVVVMMVGVLVASSDDEKDGDKMKACMEKCEGACRKQVPAKDANKCTMACEGYCQTAATHGAAAPPTT